MHIKCLGLKYTFSLSNQQKCLTQENQNTTNGSYGIGDFLGPKIEQ